MGKTIKDSLKSRGPVREFDDRKKTADRLRETYSARVPRESKRPPAKEQEL